MACILNLLCVFPMLDIGAAYGTSKSGIGIATMGVLKPDLIMKNIVPVVMAGILGIYGLIVSVILIGKIDSGNYTYDQGFKHLSAGICCGFSSLVSELIVTLVGGRIRDRDRWRRGSSGKRAGRQTLYGDDSDSHFRRGDWLVRDDCRDHFEFLRKLPGTTAVAGSC